MRIDVDGTGFREASALLHDANLWAARHHAQLSRGLAGTGEMAGDSALAGSWARAYDETAATLVAGLEDAVSALSTLGQLALTSLENHTRAERASTFGPDTLVQDPSPTTDDWVSVVCAYLPPSLGGDLAALPDWANAILDHIEGFIWPDADLDKLRAAARTWRTTGEQLDEVATYPRRAIDALLGELSPEILPATAAMGRAAMAIEDLAVGCRDIATTCEEYAGQVQTQRDAILDLVRDLLRDAVVIQVAGFLLGFVTFGTANGGAVAINSARLAAAAPRFRRIVDALRIYADNAAQALSGTRVAMAGVGARLRPMTDTRLLLSEVGHVGSKAGRAKSFLRAHEGGPMRAHTIRKHVGKSDDYLRERLRRERKNFVSTFDDQDAAEDAITSVLRTRSSKLDSFLASAKNKTLIEAPVSGLRGRVMMQSGDIVDGKTVALHLQKDASMPDGYRIITTFINP